jgi:SAM-dependent methyltransferase
MEEEAYLHSYENEKTYWLYVSRRRTVMRLLSSFMKVKGRILDLGCGTGGNMRHFSRFGTVFGLDMEKKAIEFAKKNNKSEKFVLSGADALPFKKGSFKGVLMLEVLEHVEDDMHVLKEIRGALEDGGLLFMSVPAHMFLWRELDEVAHHFRRYNIHELRKLVEAAGFEVMFIRYWGAFTLLPLIINNLKNRMKRDLLKRPISLSDDLPKLGKFENHIMDKLVSLDERLMMAPIPRNGSTIYVVAKKKSL